MAFQLGLNTEYPVNGKSYVDPVPGPAPAKVLPGTTSFELTFTSNSPMVFGPVTFDVQGVAYRFTNDSANAISSKGAAFEGFLSATDADVPEPASLLNFGGGLLLLFLASRRPLPGRQSRDLPSR